MKKRMARVGETEPAVTAVEKHDIDEVLEIANLSAQRRLSQVEARRGPTDVPLFRDGYKIAQMPEFHACQYACKAWKSKRQSNCDERWRRTILT